MILVLFFAPFTRQTELGLSWSEHFLIIMGAEHLLFLFPGLLVIYNVPVSAGWAVRSGPASWIAFKWEGRWAAGAAGTFAEVVEDPLVLGFI